MPNKRLSLTNNSTIQTVSFERMTSFNFARCFKALLEILRNPTEEGILHSLFHTNLIATPTLIILTLSLWKMIDPTPPWEELDLNTFKPYTNRVHTSKNYYAIRISSHYPVDPWKNG